MQAVATWRKGHEFLLEDGRAHSVLIDLPPEDGGASAGTTPRELSVLALAGSIVSTFASVAHKHRLDYSGLTLALEGDAPSGSDGGLHGTLRVRTRAERTEVDALLRATLELCPISRIYREARLPVHIVVVVASTARPS